MTRSLKTSRRARGFGEFAVVAREIPTSTVIARRPARRAALPVVRPGARSKFKVTGVGGGSSKARVPRTHRRRDGRRRFGAIGASRAARRSPSRRAACCVVGRTARPWSPSRSFCSAWRARPTTRFATPSAFTGRHEHRGLLEGVLLSTGTLREAAGASCARHRGARPAWRCARWVGDLCELRASVARAQGRAPAPGGGAPPSRAPAGRAPAPRSMHAI